MYLEITERLENKHEVYLYSNGAYKQSHSNQEDNALEEESLPIIRFIKIEDYVPSEIPCFSVNEIEILEPIYSFNLIRFSK